MNAPHNERESRTQGQEVRRPRRKDRPEKSEGERESPLMAATLARMNEAFERSTKP